MFGIINKSTYFCVFCILLLKLRFRENGTKYTVKKNADGLKEVKTNLRFFGLSYSFYFSF